MSKKSPTEDTKAREGVEKPAAAQKPKSAPAEKPVADRKKDTRRKVEKTLAPKIPNFSETLSTKAALKSIIKRYLRDCVKIPKEDLEETTNLTLQELSKENDESGRKLDSIYWFPEGTVIQIKNGKLFAKKREGKKVQTLISGKEIKVVTPDEAATPTAEPTPVPAAPEQAETAKPTALPEDIINQAAERKDWQALAQERQTNPDRTIRHAARDILEAHVEDIDSQDILIVIALNGIDLDKRITAVKKLEPRYLTTIAESEKVPDELRLAAFETISKLPEPPATPLSPETIALLTQKRAEKLIGTPGILKELASRITTLKENADTWKTEVECIIRSSQILTQEKVNAALTKYNTLLLAESDKLRGQINDIEKSSVYNDELKAKLDRLKEQIRQISQSLEMPVKDLRYCLSRLLAPNGGQPNVIKLRSVRSGPTAPSKPVDATGVFAESDSWITKALRWAGFKK